MWMTQDITQYERIADKLEKQVERLEHLPSAKAVKYAYKNLKIDIEVPRIGLKCKDVEVEQRISELREIVLSAETEQPIGMLRKLFGNSEAVKLSYDEAKIRLQSQINNVKQLDIMHERFASLEQRAKDCFEEAKQHQKEARWGTFKDFFTKEHNGTRLLYSVASTITTGLVAGTIAYQAGLEHAPVEQVVITHRPLPIERVQKPIPKIPPKEWTTSYEAPTREAGLPSDLQKILDQENLNPGSKYILIDKEENIVYAGKVGEGIEHILKATTGINPGDRTSPDQGTTPTGAFYITKVRNTKGLSASSGVKDAFGSTAAVLDTTDGQLGAIWNSESNIWLHSQPAWQDDYLEIVDFSAGCPHVSEESMQQLKQDGYIERGTLVGISGDKQWDGLSDTQQRSLYNRLYRAFVSLEPGRTPNEDISKFGADPAGFRALTTYLVNAYRMGHEGGA